MNKKIIVATLLTVISTISLSTASAQQQQRKGPPGGKPPTEAFEACASVSENQSCSFSKDDNIISGVCKMPPRGQSELICVPEGGRPSN